MADQIIRQFGPDGVEVDAAARTVSGTLAVYGTARRTSGSVESVAPGALSRTLSERSSRVRLLRDGEVVGRVVDFTDTDTEATLTFRLSNSPAGDAALDALADVGRFAFAAVIRPVRDLATDDGTVERQEVRLDDVELVTAGAPLVRAHVERPLLAAARLQLMKREAARLAPQEVTPE